MKNDMLLNKEDKANETITVYKGLLLWLET